MISGTDKYFESDEFKGNLTYFEKCKREGKSCILGSEEFADISEFYFEKGKTTDAKEVAEYAASIYPDAPAPKFILARYNIIISRNKEKAKEYIDQITECNDLNYTLLIAEYYLFTDNLRKAIKAFDNAATFLEGEDLEDLPYEACNLLLVYGKTEEAKGFLSKCGNKKENDYLQLEARIAFSEKRYDEGAKIIEKQLDNDPFNTALWKLLATEQNNCDKYSEAATSIGYALALDGNDAESYMILGNAYFKMCNYDKAINAYEKYEELQNDETGDLMIARCHFCKQNMEEALRYLTAAEEKCADRYASKAEIYRDFAVIYGWIGEYDKALHYLDEFEEYRERDAEYFLVAGGILLGMKRYDDANAAFYNGLKISEDKTEFTYQVGVTLYEHSLDEHAYIMFKKVFEDAPGRTKGLAYLAACCNYLGMQNEFIETLEKAVEKNPEEAKAILADFFPKGMEPYDYVEYAKRSSANRQRGYDDTKKM